MKNKKLKTILTALMCVILLSMMAVSVFATGGGGSGDVAGAIQGTWDTAIRCQERSMKKASVQRGCPFLPFVLQYPEDIRL